MTIEQLLNDHCAAVLVGQKRLIAQGGQYAVWMQSGDKQPKHLISTGDITEALQVLTREGDYL